MVCIQKDGATLLVGTWKKKISFFAVEFRLNFTVLMDKIEAGADLVRTITSAN